MDEEEEFEFPEAWERRFMRTDVVVLGLNLATSVVQAFADTLLAAQGLVAAHANFQISQHEFQEEAALEIETLISGDES